MSNELIFRHTATFNATPEAVWDLLVNPAKVKAYMFGCDIETTWEVGTPLIWKMADKEGNVSVAVKGDILAFEDGKHLAYTLFPPDMPMEDVPENYIRASFTVEAAGEQTHLHIVQDDFEGAAEAQKRFDDTVAGWPHIIPMMEAAL